MCCSCMSSTWQTSLGQCERHGDTGVLSVWIHAHTVAVSGPQSGLSGTKVGWVWLGLTVVCCAALQLSRHGYAMCPYMTGGIGRKGGRAVVCWPSTLASVKTAEQTLWFGKALWPPWYERTQYCILCWLCLLCCLLLQLPC